MFSNHKCFYKFLQFFWRHQIIGTFCWIWLSIPDSMRSSQSIEVWYDQRIECNSNFTRIAKMVCRMVSNKRWTSSEGCRSIRMQLKYNEGYTDVKTVRDFKSSNSLLIELFVSRIRFLTFSYALERGIRREENVTVWQ